MGLILRNSTNGVFVANALSFLVTYVSRRCDHGRDWLGSEESHMIGEAMVEVCDLHAGDAKVCESACRILRYLSLGSRDTLEFVAGVVSTLVAVLRAHREIPEICECALGALECLAAWSEAINEAIFSNSTLLHIIAALHTHPKNPQVCMEACAVLTTLCAGSEARKEFIVSAGAVRDLCVVWHFHGGETRAYANQALMWLGFNCNGRKR